MVAGRHGQSGPRVTVAVDEASRNEPGAALTPPLSMEACPVMDRPYKNCLVQHCALVILLYSL